MSYYSTDATFRDYFLRHFICSEPSNAPKSKPENNTPRNVRTSGYEMGDATYIKVTSHVKNATDDNAGNSGDASYYRFSPVEKDGESIMYLAIPKPTRIIYGDKATVVMWADGTKTVVRRAPDEAPSLYNAFSGAVMQKMFGTTSAAKKYIQRREDNYLKAQRAEEKEKRRKEHAAHQKKSKED